MSRIGWRLERHGGNHDIWTDGHRALPVPRHRAIDERVAKAILRGAEPAAANRRDGE
ncbi:MAG: type II toxin-antitoxin system HicA family toxin [Acidobacteriia bacterium]|nr:type II toxin-antitoxin system HicA family toxin [Terriglobia bacterium]MYG03807.1 type II toxin-antitoxin system HicA family toxin [Terriglobia bacterium]MYK12043.1 type II toxin-antitoxin system HicA family toxin [Terriglobia bacterium]